MSRTSGGRSRGPATERATSPVVGVVLLVGLTVVLAGVSAAVVALDASTTEPAPRVHLDVRLDATDGWPDGQQLRLVHEAGDALDVSEIALVVVLRRVDAHARVAGFPARRLTDGNVTGDSVFDRTYAGVDGALDAAYADGRWRSGEAATVRIAQRAVDVRPGDRGRVRVVHEPSGTALADRVVTAT